MKRLLIVGLFASACLVLSSVAESEHGAGGVAVLGNGDVNGDNSLDLSDAIYLLAHLFQGGPAPADCPGGGGAQGEGGVAVLGNGDVNGDNSLDLSDAIYLLAHLFQGGPAPADCPGTPTTETSCDDNQDNDEDGFTDCADSDCSGVSPCPVAEICTGEVDEDEDGATDCADCDCVGDPACEVESCPATGLDCPSLATLGFTAMGQNSQGLPLWEHDASGIIFVELPGGTVNLGAQSAEAGDPNFDVDAEASEDNLPGSDPLDGDGRAHLVTLGPFLIAESEVTQAQYQAVTGTNPSSFTGDLQRPVENLEWNKLHETARFDGQGGFTGVDGFLERACLSLPTEAQWEYACRAGQEAPISGNGAIDDMGWYGGNSDTGSGQETHPVKTKAPNQFGLFDMHGNVLEMCEDVFDQDFYAAAAAAGPDPLRGCTPGSNCGLSRRVTRGGGYGSSSGDCRSSTRGGFLSQGGTYPSVGFRPVFDVPRCSETDCGDGVDNDLDHATDCDDSDCAADLACDAGCGAEPAPIDGFTLLGCNAQGSFEWQHDQTGIICVQLPGGTFDMGGQSVEATDPNYDAAVEDQEGPVHPVTLSAFLIGKYEVTQCQWEALMGSNPSFFSGDPGDGDRPVDSATWNEVHGGFGVEGGFLQRTCPPLSLPTEAQWEYACRAGQEAPYSGNGILDDMGWHFNHRAGGYHDDSGACKGRETHPVGQRQANQFGLFDMHGNVEEFCEDNHNPNFYSTPEAAGPDPLFDCICGTSKRITRGGSWYGGATEGRSSSRGGYAGQGTRYEWVGFRVAFPVPGP